MDESFWYFTEEPQDPRTAEMTQRAEQEPSQQPMKPQGGPQRRPDATRRRKMKRSASGYLDHVDWDAIHPQIDSIHRGIGLNLPDDLHRFVHDESRPTAERAHALLGYIAQDRGRSKGDRRSGLGMHWSMNRDIGEDFGHKEAEHYAEANKDYDNAHDFQWGSVPGLVDEEKLKQHVHEMHGIHPAAQGGRNVRQLHEELHRGGAQIPGQQELFPEPPQDPQKAQHIEDQFREPPDPRGKPGTAVVLHSPRPAREDIDEDPYENPGRGGEVYHPFSHGEREVPIRSGASLPISGISWMPVSTSDDAWHDKWKGYTHHSFIHPEHHEARKQAIFSEVIKNDFSPTDWDEMYPSDEELKHSRLHRAIQLHVPVELHRQMEGDDLSHEEIAHHVLRQARQHPHLGMHWTADEGHAYKVAAHPEWGAGSAWYSGQEKTPESQGPTYPVSVILHAHWPAKEHLETDPSVLRRFHVQRFGSPHDEWEAPVKTGAPMKITGVSWNTSVQPRERGFRHHSFEKPVQHLATVLNTQVERLNTGDQIRTPTGQTMKVHKIRPHETESGLVYMDTDQGTTTVRRGTDMSVVPEGANTSQQELPDIGNPVNEGNSGKLPMAGHGPQGPGSNQNTMVGADTPCPNCGSLGTFRLHGQEYSCSVCGFTVGKGATPGGLLFSPQQGGHIPPRRKPGAVPRAHVWGSRYAPLSTEGVVARRARQVLDEEENA